MTPFADRRHGPTWFKGKFPAHNPTHQAESLEIWKAFFTPKLLSTRTSSKKTQVCFAGYQPNLVAGQFGHYQFKSDSYFQRKKYLCVTVVGMTEETCFELLVEHAEYHLELTLFKFHKSFYCTQEFDTWWKDYSTIKFVDVMTKLTHLTTYFLPLHTKINKDMSTNINEIHAFQPCFETMYDPLNLHRTIFEAATTLNEKFLEKLPEIKIPSYVEDRYLFYLF